MFLKLLNMVWHICENGKVVLDDSSRYYDNESKKVYMTINI